LNTQQVGWGWADFNTGGVFTSVFAHARREPGAGTGKALLNYSVSSAVIFSQKPRRSETENLFAYLL
jgi:hypothetical protein